MGHTCKNGSRLEKGHTWKNGSHSEKRVTLRKMADPLKNGPHLERWVTRFEKGVTLGKMDHTWKKQGDTLKMGHTLRIGSLLEKCVTLGIKNHT